MKTRIRFRTSHLTIFAGLALLVLPFLTHNSFSQTASVRPTATPDLINTSSPIQKPRASIPQTAQEGYESVVPEALQTEKKFKQLEAKIEDLRNQIDALKPTIPDKSQLSAITQTLNRIITSQRTLDATFSALRTDVEHITTQLAAYGNGYQAAEAQATKMDQDKKPKQPGTDPMNPNRD